MRVSIVGCSGAGKSTLARRLERELGLPRLELDSLCWQPDWTKLPQAEFQARVREFLDTHDRWVIDGNYGGMGIRELVWSRATTALWLDLPRWHVMRAIIPRTLRRVVGREDLWNGNREELADALSWDPRRSMIRWAWVRHSIYHQRFFDAMYDSRWAHLDIVQFQTRAGIDAWVRAQQSGSAHDSDAA